LKKKTRHEKQKLRTSQDVKQIKESTCRHISRLNVKISHILLFKQFSAAANESLPAVPFTGPQYYIFHLSFDHLNTVNFDSLCSQFMPFYGNSEKFFHRLIRDFAAKKK